jgi:hypothetical protein
VLLTDDDLVRVTGCTQSAAQARFLKDHYGLVVAQSKLGNVALTWEALTRAQLGDAGKVKREPVLRM